MTLPDSIRALARPVYADVAPFDEDRQRARADEITAVSTPFPFVILGHGRRSLRPYSLRADLRRIRLTAGRHA